MPVYILYDPEERKYIRVKKEEYKAYGAIQIASCKSLSEFKLKLISFIINF